MYQTPTARRSLEGSAGAGGLCTILEAKGLIEKYWPHYNTGQPWVPPSGSRGLAPLCSSLDHASVNAQGGSRGTAAPDLKRGAVRGDGSRSLITPRATAICD